jgi:RecB family exonuclease
MAYVANVRGLRVRLGCKADRVSIDVEGVLEVLDYKTNASGRIPTTESLSSDLPNFLYYVLARIHYPDHRRIRVSQLNVLTLARVAVEYCESQVSENKRALMGTILEMSAGDFAPAPTEACAWCRVQDHCPLYGKEVDLDSVT